MTLPFPLTSPVIKTEKHNWCLVEIWRAGSPHVECSPCAQTEKVISGQEMKLIAPRCESFQKGPKHSHKRKKHTCRKQNKKTDTLSLTFKLRIVVSLCSIAISRLICSYFYFPFCSGLKWCSWSYRDFLLSCVFNTSVVNCVTLSIYSFVFGNTSELCIVLFPQKVPSCAENITWTNLAAVSV